MDTLAGLVAALWAQTTLGEYEPSRAGMAEARVKTTREVWGCG
jgi:hypothetical protein